MNHHDNIGVKKPECCESFFTIVKADVRNAESRPGEYFVGLPEIEPVLLYVRLPLSLIPRKPHEYIIHIIIHIAKWGDQ